MACERAAESGYSSAEQRPLDGSGWFAVAIGLVAIVATLLLPAMEPASTGHSDCGAACSQKTVHGASAPSRPAMFDADR